MSKAVLISIRPEWCEKIASGQKTIEVRKNRPKIETPFKCFIYCTKPKIYNSVTSLYLDELYRLPTGEIKYGLSIDLARFPGQWNKDNFLNGKVIGEFVCDMIVDGNAHVQNWLYISEHCCVPGPDLYKYCGEDENGDTKYCFGWHISDLVIYDKPKELREFFVIDKKAVKECSLRERIYTNPDYTNGVCLPGTYICNKDPVDIDFCRGGCWKKSLSRPPQSWCYVEEI